MQVVDVARAIGKLKPPCFPFLVPDAERFSVLLVQPKGDVVARKSGVRHADQGQATAKFSSFLKYAHDKEVDLAVCPEYSCPWSALREAIQKGLVPKQNALWILSCEAFSAGDLEKFKEEIKEHADVFHEDFAKLGGNADGFLDPVCYLFHAHNSENESRLVVLVQFKVTPMGGHAYELDNLRTGTSVYLFRNEDEHTIKLLTLLCSDVLGWDGAGCNELRDLFSKPNSLLVFHPQLNKQARHPLYRRYRATLLSSQNRRQLVCLNWARDVTETEPDQQGKTTSWNNDAVSAVYARQWNPPLMDDEALEAEEAKGIYFGYCGELRSFVGVLNFAEFCFLLKLTKVNQDLAPEAHRIARPPEVAAVLNWAGNTNSWVPAKYPLEADYTASMTARGIDVSKLAMLPTRPLRFERLAALSCGGLKDIGEVSAGWPRFTSIDALNLDSAESIRRTSFAQDRSDAAAQFRAVRYVSFASFMTLVADGAFLRPTMAAFRGARVDFDVEHPFCNLFTNAGRRATAVFLNDTSLQAAEDMLTRVVNQSVAAYALRGLRDSSPHPDENTSHRAWTKIRVSGQGNSIVRHRDCAANRADGDQARRKVRGPERRPSAL
jgi:hypothetical protein